VPSAQVKGAVLLAGLAADGETTVIEPSATRDHTERALGALGGPVRIDGRSVSIRAFEPPGFAASVPGDLSSAVFVLVASALSGGAVEIEGVGLNPSRTHVLEVLRRAGVPIEVELEGTELGEPYGRVASRRVDDVGGFAVDEEELPLVIDEVPALAMLAAHASGESRFVGAGELRVKESDRLTAIAEAVRALGGHAAVEGEDLLLAGGGLAGGTVDARGDHRMAMAAFVAAQRARGGVAVDGIETVDVSFPGFLDTMRALGAEVDT
jgi:3-phosphoshikimate 1-carboxyvinyltransferase